MAAKDIVLFIMILFLICAFIWQVISDEKKKESASKPENEKARQDLIKREEQDIHLDSEQ